MDIHRVISGAVLIVLVCASCIWAARLIQDEGPAPLPKQAAQSPTPSQSKQTDAAKSQGVQQAKPGVSQGVPGASLPKVSQPRMNMTPTPEQGATQPSQAPRQPMARNAADSGGQFITMDFDGVDIKVFIKFIADITGKNFIIDDKVTGKITVISPRKMTLDEAYRVFLSVLEVNGFGSVDMGGVTKIVRSADAITKSLDTALEAPLQKDDTMVTQIIQLKYVDANDMKNLLTPLMSKASSQLLSYPQTNVLIVTDNKANIKKLMDILKVVDVAGFAQEVKIMPLTYASASDLASKLNDILSEGKQEEAQRLRAMRQPDVAGTKTATKIIPYERTNSLIVLAAPPDVSGIEELIKKLDIPTPSGKEDIHVYYLQYASAEDLAKVLTEIPTPENPEAPAQPSGTTAAGQTAAQQIRAKATTPNTALKEQNIKISPDKETNSLIIYADPYQYKSIVETIKYLDIPRKQVYVEAMIMEVDASNDFRVGVEWTYASDFKYDHGEKTGYYLGKTGENFVTSPNSLPGGPLFGVIGEAITITQGSTSISFPNMTSFINAMSKNSDVKVISTPQVLTMDNKEAEIKVGKNVPYLTRQDTDSTNIDRTVNSYDYRDVGVTLKLTPQINQTGTIRMKLFQEISTLVPGTGEAQYAPTTLKRSASTTVTVKDNSTIVIGGLTGDTLSLGNYQVPLLGDIPILGYLFKTLTKNREQTTLYIFLTPKIIDTEQRVEALYREKEKDAEDAKDPTKFSKGKLK